MVYVAAFGEVSPCVFIPMTFGNVMDQSIETIFMEMKRHFPSEECCFINKNYELLKKYIGKHTPIRREDSSKLMQDVQFGDFSKFFQL